MPPEPNGVGTTWTMRMLEVCLVTLGSPQQLTGGYLYHLRMAERAGQFGADLTFVSVAEGGWARQVASGVRAMRTARAGDVIVVDSIVAAPVAVSPAWSRPLAAMVHQPPGGMEGGAAARRVR